MVPSSGAPLRGGPHPRGNRGNRGCSVEPPGYPAERPHPYRPYRVTELWAELDGLSLVGVTGFGLGVVIFIASSWLAPTVWSLEKAGSYECGFEPFEDARSRFDVRFYLVALLFIIFDLEVAFLFPLVGQTLGVTGVWFSVVFLGVLTAGFVYEWCQGALSWS